MARQRPSFYSAIEYIGPRPQKPKKPNIFGGWVIVVIALGIGVWFGRPLFQSAYAAENGISSEETNSVISTLSGSENFGDRLAAVALSHSRESVSFDSSYYKIDFPGGDVPANKGNAEDVIVRCFRRLGVDLQKDINEDMKANFSVYPQLWDASAPDTNIDHRRAPNLQRFFSRHGETLKTSRKAEDYQPGDIVVWGLSKAKTDIGIVVPAPAGKEGDPWIVHNNGSGVKWESGLFDYQIIGHFRYTPNVSGKAAAVKAEAAAETF